MIGDTPFIFVKEFKQLNNGQHEIALQAIIQYRYRSYRYDNDLQLYYLQSRYYDPTIGRFINADSVNYLNPSSYTGMNLYAYAANNSLLVQGFDVKSGHIVTASHRSVGNSSLFNHVIASGSFQGGWGYGEGSIIFAYREGQGRFEWKIGQQDERDKFGIKIGYFEKISLFNGNGSIGFGTLEDNIVGIKGVVDIATGSGLLGISIEPNRNYYVAGVDVGVAAINGRIGLTIADNFEIGVYGEAAGAGYRFGIIFDDGELKIQGGSTFGVGGGVYIRIKFW